ncbi:MAG: hypothetical protein AAF570_08740, partial [Bacteroidota bacterium]
DKSSVTLGPGQAGGGIGAPVIGAIYRRIYKEQGKAYPRFEDTPMWKNPPTDIVKAGCGGYGMGPKEGADLWGQFVPAAALDQLWAAIFDAHDGALPRGRRAAAQLRL